MVHALAAAGDPHLPVVHLQPAGLPCVQLQGARQAQLAGGGSQHLHGTELMHDAHGTLRSAGVPRFGGMSAVSMGELSTRGAVRSNAERPLD